MPSEPHCRFRIVVVLTSAGGLSNPRVRADPVIDPPQADIELDALFAPYGIIVDTDEGRRWDTIGGSGYG